MKQTLILFLLVGTITLNGVEPAKGEPTNATEAAAAADKEARKKAQVEAIKVKYMALVAKLPPEEQAWEQVLQANLGEGFYLPAHRKDKVAGLSTAWDFVKEDPKLPSVILVGDSVSRGYTLATRKKLVGKANVFRAPANCGPTATGVQKLDIWLGDKKWDVIHFNFGIHDRWTPLADYAKRLEEIVVRLKKTGAKLIWATSTPIPDDPATKQTSASMVERNQVAAEIMKKHGVDIDDLFTVMTPQIAKFQRPKDVHFTEPGYDFLGAQVATSIEKVLVSKKTTPQVNSAP